METKIAIAMVGLVVLIGYSIIMTLYVFFPKTLIRWDVQPLNLGGQIKNEAS